MTWRAVERNSAFIRKMVSFACLALLGCLALWTPPTAHADQQDTLNVSCTSATVSAAVNTTATIPVNCTINAPDADKSYRITPSSGNFMTPATVSLYKGTTFLSALLQSAVTSPDNSVLDISGGSGGFTAEVTPNSAPKKLRFTYSVSVGSVSSGTYSALTSVFYSYRICNKAKCNQQVFAGLASTAMSLNVTAAPVTISCASPSVSATPGGGPFTLGVVCTLSSGNPGQMSPSGQNFFSPSTITLSGSSANLTATLQSTVTSPDGSVGNISGTAGGGFTGTINAIPAKVQINYSGNTTNTTPAGTYTSAPVVFAWSTL